MTDLDRQVATLRGWKIIPRQPREYICPETGETRYDWQDEYWIDANGKRAFIANYSPSTNLLQAYKLWDEARPEGFTLHTSQNNDGSFSVGVRNGIVTYFSYAVTLADIPRAITEALVEAREGKP